MISEKIEVKVITRCDKVEIKKIDERRYKVKLTEAPEKDKANKQLVEVLADYFNVKKTALKIVSGMHTTTKKILIEKG